MIRYLVLSQDMDASDWMKGIFFSVLASVIGASAKLAIRKSWLMEAETEAAARAVFMNGDISHHSSTANNNNNDVERLLQHGSYVGPTLEDLESNRHQQSLIVQSEPAPQEDLNREVLQTGGSGEGSDESSYHTAASVNPNEPTVGEGPEIEEREVYPLDEPDEQDTQPHQHQQQQLGNRRRGKSVYEAVNSDQLSPPPSPCRHRNITQHEDDFDDDDILEIDSTELQHLGCCCCDCCSRCCCGCCSNYCCSSAYFTKARLLRWFGMFNMSVGNPIACVVAMNYASPSILAPFSGLTLVWVIVFSKPLIGEVPTMAQKIASMLIVAGEVTVAIFGDHSSDDDATIDSVLESYKEPAFLMFFAGLTMWMLLLVFWISTPLSSCCNSPTLRRFAWGASGGSLTGLQNFLKDSLVVVKKTPSLRHLPWCVPVFVMLQIAASFGGLLFLTGSMKRYDAAYSAAMFVGSFVVSTSIMSAAHYHTFEHLADVADIIMYPLGLVILMAGVFILVQLGSSDGHVHHDDPDDSDRIVLTSPTGVQYLNHPGGDDAGDDAAPVILIIPETSNANSSNHDKDESFALAETPTPLTLSTRSATVSASITDDDQELI